MTPDQVFREAWGEIMSREPLDLSLTWSEAGVDSFQRLRLMLHLEVMLGQKVTFDEMTSDKTIASFLLNLKVSNGVPIERQPNRIDHGSLFLLPGVFGDEPSLAEFRASLASELQIQTLAIPDTDTQVKWAASMASTARFAINQLLIESPHGPVRLAGYSFGGLVAFEMARQLVQAGRQVEAVLLLDPPTREKSAEVVEDEAGSSKRNGGQAISARLDNLFFVDRWASLERLAFAMALRSGAYALARWLLNRHRHLHLFERNHERRRRLLYRLRMKALRAWRPKALSAPVLLVTSDDYGSADQTSPWEPLCPGLSRLHVGGRHLELFETRPLHLMRPVILEMMCVGTAGFVSHQSRAQPSMAANLTKSGL